MTGDDLFLSKEMTSFDITRLFISFKLAIEEIHY